MPSPPGAAMAREKPARSRKKTTSGPSPSPASKANAKKLTAKKVRGFNRPAACAGSALIAACSVPAAASINPQTTFISVSGQGPPRKTSVFVAHELENAEAGAAPGVPHFAVWQPPDTPGGLWFACPWYFQSPSAGKGGKGTPVGSPLVMTSFFKPLPKPSPPKGLAAYFKPARKKPSQVCPRTPRLFSNHCSRALSPYCFVHTVAKTRNTSCGQARDQGMLVRLVHWHSARRVLTLLLILTVGHRRQAVVHVLHPFVPTTTCVSPWSTHHWASRRCSTEQRSMLRPHRLLRQLQPAVPRRICNINPMPRRPRSRLVVA